MSVDASLTGPRPERSTAHDVRQRLEHARSSRLTQLQALQETGQSADDHLAATQKSAIEGVLKEIESAFTRVDNGTYGICLGCRKPVPAERLEILPYTPHCVGCQGRSAVL
ncbi:TraR/DksA C4-type zinc finger protein [Streptomyces sp. LHD-70]|uniref:TraR/DksA family transcriptional regulator n=1 Tax=Streptomyces sp. LHD-70 TaxID=3072140 RepID=UPI00280CE5B9|nr:TraR/DksA C4-type zinc finger protein [Streptomyces sp. LHD-70]MDQ8705614.1 TraR/DksA C4-type zinc finger protein [Streptomyces sp. LHD-70]